MNAQFNVIIERDADGYFVASVPNLPGCHTQAKSLDELMVRIKEAIILCLEVQPQGLSIRSRGVQEFNLRSEL